MAIELLPKDEWRISFEGDCLILKIEVSTGNYIHCRGYKLHAIGSGDNLPALDNLKGIEFAIDMSDA